jgi:hypothetical protein
MKYLFVSIFVINMVSISCNRNTENCHDSISIINNSGNAIYFSESFRYPDTLTLYPNPSLDPGYFKINSNSCKNDITRDCFEDEFTRSTQGIIMFYIYDALTLETTSWDTVKAKYLILKRYDLTLKDIKDMNWSITYP